jgi:hypothetical protein
MSKENKPKKNWKEAKLKGLEDFGDVRYSLGRHDMIEGGREGGNSVSSEEQSIKGKITAKINMESGQIHDVFIKAGHEKRDEMINSGEWTEIASKGGHTTASKWKGQKDHMRDLHKKVDQVKKAKSKIAKNEKIRQEFINEVLSELPNEFTNREAEELVVSKGKGSYWCRRWLYKDPRVTKTKFDGKISYFLQNSYL